MGKVHIITVRNVPWDGEFSLTVTARQVVREVLRLEACLYDVQVGLTLTDDDEIRELNRTYREIDRATDVLSFPNLSLPQPSCFTAAQEDPAGAFDPETGELMLGDIVISKPHMEQQAADYGHSLKREFAFLVASVRIGSHDGRGSTGHGAEAGDGSSEFGYKERINGRKVQNQDRSLLRSDSDPGGGTFFFSDSADEYDPDRGSGVSVRRCRAVSYMFHDLL